jgi:hypothetical protein
MNKKEINNLIMQRVGKIQEYEILKNRQVELQKIADTTLKGLEYIFKNEFEELQRVKGGGEILKAEIHELTTKCNNIPNYYKHASLLNEQGIDAKYLL